MLVKTEVAGIYETVLSFPGMNDNVKIALTLPRKNVLFLSKIIDRGLSKQEGEGKNGNVLETEPPQTLKDLMELATELLEKAGLTALNQKLQSF